SKRPEPGAAIKWVDRSFRANGGTSKQSSCGVVNFSLRSWRRLDGLGEIRYAAFTPGQPLVRHNGQARDS
ncbi:MAG: hypothetical protein WAK03_05925, partial [Methylocystis sp.]